MARARFHLTFPERLIQEPVIYRLGKEHEVVTNIRRANIDERFGWMILEMEGTERAVADAVAWLVGQGITVERIADEGSG